MAESRWKQGVPEKKISDIKNIKFVDRLGLAPRNCLDDIEKKIMTNPLTRSTLVDLVAYREKRRRKSIANALYSNARAELDEYVKRRTRQLMEKMHPSA
jgi:hypothetical protein